MVTKDQNMECEQLTKENQQTWLLREINEIETRAWSLLPMLCKAGIAEAESLLHSLSEAKRAINEITRCVALDHKDEQEWKEVMSEVICEMLPAKETR